MTEQSTAHDVLLPAGYQVRPATRADAQGLTDLINASDVSLGAPAEETIEDTYERWDEAGFDMERGTRVAVTDDGLVVGYEESQDDSGKARIWLDGYIHPEHAGRGLGTTLLRWAEQRGREIAATYPDDASIEMIAHCYSQETAAVSLFQNENYQLTRHYWRMEIEMTDAPTVPVMPAGITLRAFATGQDDRAVHAAVTEAFLDHWGSLPQSFEEWSQSRINTDSFDPSLWLLAVDQATGEIAGTSLCRVRGEDRAGWVSTLAVRRAWRKQGLGMALLQHSFAEFYQRGLHKVGLGVDADSLTGATRLYERAGMHIAHRFDRFAKTLQGGAKASAS
jgi:mycothiol synthase